MRKASRLAASAGVLATAAVMAAGAVQALPAGASTAAPAGTRVTVPMTITGFDATVAKAHGYTIRTNAQGQQYSVKSGAAAAVSPNGVIDGNCGTSYIYEYAVGNHAVDIQTGFNIDAPAVAY